MFSRNPIEQKYEKKGLAVLPITLQEAICISNKTSLYFIFFYLFSSLFLYFALLHSLFV